MLLGDADVEAAGPGTPSANGASPVGPRIAAVIATTSGPLRAGLHHLPANTCVQVVGRRPPCGWPVTGSNAGGECICSASSFSAGG